MFKNMSIRTRILAGVVLVNLLGAGVLVIYLHQSYSGDLATAVSKTGVEGLAAWEQLQLDAPVDPVADAPGALKVLERMKAITGADYALLVDKESVDQQAYDAARATIQETSVWEEGDTYAVLAGTDEQLAEQLVFKPTPGDVPENSKVIGVEVGACSKACHSSVGGKGDYWTVRWSNDSKSKGHAVFPVFGASGDAIGVIYAIDDISEQANAANKSLMKTLVAVAVTLVLATLVIGMLVDILVLRRLARMTRHIQDASMRVAGGDFNAHYEPEGTNDEIGAFQKFYSDFINLVSMTLKQLSGTK